MRVWLFSFKILVELCLFVDVKRFRNSSSFLVANLCLSGVIVTTVVVLVICSTMEWFVVNNIAVLCGSLLDFSEYLSLLQFRLQTVSIVLKACVVQSRVYSV